ncbi:hypothetical protein [Streptomyces sp. KLOTTS4A1]|uniref:LppU/SCO3897 family protein n=1 Tax=Streptomyces sp. KLOTTS4A1 TaxID=3390996 RepID=UPI0039F606F1
MTTPPPQGQNPFAQDQQGQAGQPGFPPPGAPATPPSRSNGVKKKLLSIVGIVVVAAAIGVGKWYLGQTDAETTAVGDCMKNEGTQIRPDLKTVDCSSSDAEFEVVEKFDNTSDDSKCEAVEEATISYYQTGDSSHEVVLCLKVAK